MINDNNVKTIFFQGIKFRYVKDIWYLFDRFIFII